MTARKPNTAHPQPFPYEQACKIHYGERDVNLRLDSPGWPDERTIPREFGWTAAGDRLERVIHDPEDTFLAHPLREAMLRFPSASLNGLQRRQDYHVNVEASENLHTYRVLSHPGRGTRHVRRIFLLHNGLNELDNMSLHYELASRLIGGRTDTICILRPFPGHLSRSPFQAFAETPLDRYLWDGSHLFRQFMRFMIETQWFLSALVRRGEYRLPSGAHLLAEDPAPHASRLNRHVLAPAMERAWTSMYGPSTEAIDRDRRAEQRDAVPPKAPIGTPRFLDAISSLRRLLRLPDANRQRRWRPGREPDLHVVGYSLGGYAAQSVFMSWPFLVASCSTLLSGGPLRDLAPTAFADPEEWQTVLHSLRYELDDAMMAGRYGRPDTDVAGIERDLFSYFTRTFYEVFQQEYPGSVRTRLAAFRQRMLFVVGGNDPIVRPGSVLDAAPPGGINMLEIGALGHFLAERSKEPEEVSQRTFWLPEIAGLIDRLGHRAAVELAESRRTHALNGEMLMPLKGRTADLRSLTARDRLAVERDGALPGELFERCLDDLLTRQLSRGDAALFVLRNEVPTMMLDPRSIQDRATVLSHHDVAIATYMQGALNRRQVLEDHPDRLSVILPWNVDQVMLNIDRHPGFPSQAESSGGLMPTPPDAAVVWERCLGYCDERSRADPNAVRVFNWESPLGTLRETDQSLAELLDAAASYSQGEELVIVPSMPDCWIWMSREFLQLGKGPHLSMADARAQLPGAVNHYARQDDDGLLRDMLRGEELRIVEVSRARYNPRFRGRVVASVTAAKRLLIHAALCASASQPFSDYFTGQRHEHAAKNAAAWRSSRGRPATPRAGRARRG